MLKFDLRKKGLTTHKNQISSMKITAIGDIHGRDFWKNFIEEPTDQIVFVGDYFDPYDFWITSEEEIENFKAIISFKREKPDLVTLLIGNHDYHYLHGVNQHYSRYNKSAATAITEVLEDALDMMQVCYVYKDVIFNHAGLTKTWCRNNNIDLNNLEQSLNGKFVEDRQAFGFVYWIEDHNGSDVRQSPLWVRPPQLLSDKVDGYKQVVGHTRQPSHRILQEVAFIDVAGSALIMNNVDTFAWTS
jgi:predicted MPP superfamily phosphohydrolase